MKSGLLFLSSMALCPSFSSAFQQQGRFNCHKHASSKITFARRRMQPSSIENEEANKARSRRLGPELYSSSDKRVPRTELSAATLDSVVQDADNNVASIVGLFEIPTPGPNTVEAASKVFSASLLVTSNTVGSSMFVLPNAVEGVGMLSGSALFLGLYIYNLISGLLLADVAIKLHESSDCEVPSSFKDFANAAMKSDVAGNAIGAASLLINYSFLAFGLSDAGYLAANTLSGYGVEPTTVAATFAAILAAASYTQTNHGLEKIANVSAMILFSSFASLLLPSLSNVPDPMGTILAPGTNPEGFVPAVAAAVPLILSSLIYQNIVPSITKLLNFDRTKSTIAIAFGSFIPMAMYMAWCFAALGGGLENFTENGTGGAAFTAFSASALIGSSLACIMSLAEEYESMLSENKSPAMDKFSVPAVTLAVAPPTALVLATGCPDLTCALSFCGAFLTPFLYGILPILLYQNVCRKEGDSITASSLSATVLAGGALGLIGQEIYHDISQMIA